MTERITSIDANSILPWPDRVRACAFASLGWRVMPIREREGAKTPALKDWPNTASSDMATVRDWWAGKYAGFEVGILTGPESGIWVLDIDVKWCNGFASLRDLFVGHGVYDLPRTLRVNTPSGGQQWYFRYPVDRKVRNVASSLRQPGPLGAGLDVRGWHGMVAAPWGVGRSPINSDMPTDAPDWLVEMVTREPRRARSLVTVTSADAALTCLRGMADRLAHETAGRNSALNSAAFQLGMLGAHGLLDEQEAHDALREACITNGGIAEWAGGERSFEATFNSGWTAGLATGSEQ